LGNKDRFVLFSPAVITQFWVIPQNLFFFQNKNKIKADNMEKADRKIKLQFLEEIQGLIVPHYAQEWRKMQIQGQN